jgi:ribosomal protein L29
VLTRQKSLIDTVHDGDTATWAQMLTRVAALVLCGMLGLPACANAEEVEPATARLEAAAAMNLKTQLKYNQFINHLRTQSFPGFRLFTGDNFPYHTGLFSTPYRDVANIVKEDCERRTGSYTKSQRQRERPFQDERVRSFVAGALTNGMMMAEGIGKAFYCTCEKDGQVLLQAEIVSLRSEYAGGNVFHADFYHIGLVERSEAPMDPNERAHFLAIAATLGNKTAATTLDAFLIEQRTQESAIAAEKARVARADAAEKARVAHADAEERQRTQQELEASRIAALKTALPAFRQALKIGDDTNCGLVVEVKRPIVQVQTMMGLQWLKLATLFPKSEGCPFINAAYVPPHSF